MALSVTLYKNTGFNTINIPDGKPLLAQNASISTHAIDCMQNRFLSSISVKTTWESVKDVDYANVDDFYYFVTSVFMSSFDVATLTLSPDFITSAGGPGQLSILDGITERHHIAKSADTFGLYDESDPLLSPAQPLELLFGDGLFVYGEALDSVDYYTVCESSIDLCAMGKATTLEARTYTDGDNSVTVPRTYAVTNYTDFVIEGALSTRTVGTCLFDTSDSNVQKGMQMARDLGVENAIIAQYALPKNMFNVSIEDGFVKTISSINVTGASVDLPYQYATVRNQRVLTGDCNRYGLLSAAGNSYECNPEQLYFTGVTQPNILYRGDGRENGRPYFNFSYYMGTSNNNMKTFFKNAISGMEWRNVPLTFVTPAHSVQDSYSFRSQSSRAENTNYYAGENYELGQTGRRVAGIGAGIGGLLGTAGSLITGNIGGALATAGGAAVGVLETGVAMQQAKNEEAERLANYQLERQQEIYNFGVSQSVVEPTIKFPFQTPSIRDYFGNGVISYRYRYSDTDVTRIDKILTAYGYHITEMLDASMFSNRPHFNFIKANGVSVGGNLPTWWKNGIAQQFGAGVRIWHVKPDPAYYTQNE